MEPVVHQPLGHVERRDPVLALQAPAREHELVHAEPVERKLVGVLEAREQVVGVEDGHLGHLLERRAERADVRVRADEDAERPAEPAHLADRPRPFVVEPEDIAVAHDGRHRQERLEALADSDRPATRAPTAVRLRERLVQVEVHDVEAEVAGPGDAADRVQVRAVVVHQRAGLVKDPRDLLDSLVEETEGGRVGQHQTRCLRPDLAAQLLEVDVPARVGADADHLVPRHRHAGRIRAVRRVGDHDLTASLVLAPVGEIGAHQQQARELALRARGRLERHRRQADDLGEDLLQAPHQLERSLGGVLLLKRMHVPEPRQVDDALVHPRVVLHRARPERIEAGVDAERAIGERREMPDELRLGDLGQAGRPRAAKFFRDFRQRQARLRQGRGPAAGLRFLVHELHAAKASTSRSISSGVRLSVTATSSASSRPE